MSKATPYRFLVYPTYEPSTARRLTLTLALALLCVGMLARHLDAATPTCAPYSPDGGLFINSGTAVLFTRAIATPAQKGSYSIYINTQNQVVITQGNNLAPDAVVAVPAGMLAYYLFFGNNNRFVLIDMEADPTQSLVSVNFQQAIIDLTAWSPGAPPQSGNLLPLVMMPAGTMLHMYPSASYTPGSAGGALAFLLWYGETNGTADNVGIYRSDNGKELCDVSTFTPMVQVEAKITPTDAQILDGGSIVLQCSLPLGKLLVSPPSQSFGTISPTANVTKTFTFSNSGNDCVSVTGITPSTHFSAPNFSPFALSASGASSPVSIEFSPSGAVGTFVEQLGVTTAPPGSKTVSVSGASVALPTLTVTEQLLPASDPGRFNLQIDSATVSTAVGNGGSTEAQTESVGNHIVGQIASPGTNLSNYSISIGGDCAPNGGISLALGDKRLCTIATTDKSSLPNPGLSFVHSCPNGWFWDFATKGCVRILQRQP